jgi:hypothetical protein
MFESWGLSSKSRRHFAHLKAAVNTSRKKVPLYVFIIYGEHYNGREHHRCTLA